MSERLNTQDLIDLLINRQGLEKKEAESFVKEFFSLIEEGLEKDKSVKIKGLGTFKLVDVESRESVNVNTKERIEIQGHTKISFTPDTALRDIINKPFAHFETVILNDNVDFNDTAEDVPEEIEPIKSEIAEKIEVPTEEDKEVIEIVPEEVTLENQEEEVSEEIITDDIQEEPKEEEIKEEEKEDIKEEEIKEEEKEVPEVVEEDTRTILEKIKAAEDADLSALKNQNDKEYSKNNKILTLVIVLTILLCGILLFFTYYSDLFPETKKQPPVTITPPVKTEVVTDTVSLNPIEEPIAVTEEPKEENLAKVVEEPVVKVEEPKTKIEEPKVEKPVTKPVAETSDTKKESTIPFSQIPVRPDSTSYEIVGTKTQHTIKTGETLIRISYKYYGTKDLFPYLIKHNRSVIKNPNSVPLGTTINIPELKKK